MYSFLSKDDFPSALQQLMTVNELTEFRVLLVQAPFMLEDEFVRLVEKVAERTERDGHPELAGYVRLLPDRLKLKSVL